MNKLLFFFLLIFIVMALMFICLFYIYLFKQYQRATLNYYKNQLKRKKYHEAIKQNSKAKHIKNNVTEIINPELISQRIGYAIIEFLDEHNRVLKTQTIFKPNLSIGREISNDIVLEDQTISRKQCLIRKQDGKFFICNLSETTPTILNGISVDNSNYLSFGDIISIGNYIFRFSDVIIKSA